MNKSKRMIISPKSCYIMIIHSLIIYLIIIIEMIISSVIFLFIGTKTLHSWRKSREEILIHFSLFSFGMLAVIIIFSIYVYFGIVNINIQALIIIFIIGFLYDLCYLLISIVYLSIFTNSRFLFEIYFPYIIGIAAVVNLLSEFSTTFPSSFFLSSFFHLLAFSSGTLLIVFAIFHLKKSRAYFTKQEDIRFLDYIVKILIILPFALFSDAIGFVFYLDIIYTSLKLDELLLLFLFSLIAIASVVVLFVALNIASRAKKIDLTAFLNTIS